MRQGFDLSLIEMHHKAREAVMRDTGLMPIGVDAAVVRGWQRCLSLGLEPDKPVIFQPVARSAPKALQEANAALDAVARDELRQLARSLASSDAIVILADARLSVLHAEGLHNGSAKELQLIGRAGVDTNERAIGSNALSIAAAEMSPVTVLQNAHFFSANAIFSCAGAPIRTPNGQLAGILDVTTAFRPLPGEALFLTAAAAKAIENAMFKVERHQVLVRCHPRTEFLNTPLAGLLLLSDAGDVLGANEAALQLFGLRWPLRAVRLEQCSPTPLAEVLQAAHRARSGLESGSFVFRTAAGVPLAADARINALVSPPTPIAPGPSGLSAQTPPPAQVQTPTVSLKELERQAIDKALTRHRGNIAAAARFLGVSRGTLYRRLKGKA